MLRIDMVTELWFAVGFSRWPFVNLIIQVEHSSDGEVTRTSNRARQVDGCLCTSRQPGDVDGTVHIAWQEARTDGECPGVKVALVFNGDSQSKGLSRLSNRWIQGGADQGKIRNLRRNWR